MYNLLLTLYRTPRPVKAPEQIVEYYQRTQNGVYIFARLQAFISTLRKQGLNLFTSLYSLFAFQY
jgi:hypothetical protein